MTNSNLPPRSNRIADVVFVILITLLALAVHGFHYGIEDEAIYLPAIKKYLDPSLYPFDSIFFLPQTNLSVFPKLIGLLAQITFLPLAWVVFIAHLLSLFLILAACLRLSRKCFDDAGAQWAAVVMVAALMTLPVAGTALYLVDQHLHPRSLATAAILWGLSELLDGRYYRAGAGFIIAVLIHPMMGAFGAAFAVFLLWRSGKQLLVFCLIPPLLALLPFGLSAPSAAWREAASACSHYYLLRWEWYEWIGIFAPLALLAWFGYLGRRNGLKVLQRISWRLVVFGLFFFILAVVLTIPARFERAVPFEPMRFLHLVYLTLFMFAGGLMGKWILRDRPARWLILFAPLCVLMFLVQREIFSASPHIELTGITRKSEWLEAFEWIRQNTPRDAIFALDPYYLESRGLDYHGFRALAERSMLADRIKDRAATSVAPAVAEIWFEQLRARDGWKGFRPEDWRRLKKDFGVGWIVVENGGAANPAAGLACPYRNEAVSVCKID
jgi:hypothetical protein